MDAITLSIFANRIDAVCEEMGVTLQKTAFSPNIRDRLDYSCAVFDARGELCAQAAHIPVHLGSMAYAMRGIIADIDWCHGDMVILNDPYKGGTHLPDVTLITPVFIDAQLTGFVANRAHHADIGSECPGSMPLSKSLEEEGLVIQPQKLMEKHQLNASVMDGIMQVMRNPHQSRGDFTAQMAANHRGCERLYELIGRMGIENYLSAIAALNEYAEQLAYASFKSIPDGKYDFQDVLDDDGLGRENILIKAEIDITAGKIHVDFSDTSAQVGGNVNCPLSVTAAAVYYVFRCLLPPQTPACAGSFRAIDLTASKGCLVNAIYPAAVAAGNVETSTRIVDVVLGALAKAIPDLVPAASHGTMNNLAMGSDKSVTEEGWDYYETIGGGMGASAVSDGLDAVQTHMTNTLNTPIESLEMNYPLRINRYAVRQQSGGEGTHKGGDGIVREYQFLQAAEMTLLTERRTKSPWGIENAEPAKMGVNYLNEKKLPGKISYHVDVGDVLRLETPGGGGFG